MLGGAKLERKEKTIFSKSLFVRKVFFLKFYFVISAILLDWNLGNSGEIPHLMVQFPRFVANITIGEIVDSRARCK